MNFIHTKFQKCIYLFVSSICYIFSTHSFADDQGNVTDYQLVTQKLDEARNGMAPETGSSTYTFDKQAIQNLPLGDNSQVSDVLLRAPGVAQDSYGQLHVRGDHADLQYRINGVILPEGITGFGQTLDTHFADNINFMTGALPAQYGYRTAGVVDITTKSGAVENGGRTTLMGGSNNTAEVNQELYGSKGPLNYYFTANYDQNDRGVEPPTSSTDAIHDQTKQDKEFGYLSYVLNPDQRLSFIFGNSTNRFQIPNNPGQAPTYTTPSIPAFDSATLNENQVEHNTYGIASLQGVAGDKTDYQVSFFSRDSTVQYQPDQLGDLLFNGIAAQVEQKSVTSGLQSDFSYHLNDNHIIRSGLSFSYEQASSDANSAVFPAAQCDINNVCTLPTTTSTDNHSKDATLLGVYVQDEWKAFDKLTINYGARYDDYNAYVSGNQLSPRIGAIYELTPDTKLHAGFARYFTPPSTELIAPVTISAFQNTTGALPTTASSPVVPETDNYYDIGAIQKVSDHLTLGVDAYDKEARNLLDEGQFGSALIFAPFNYTKGYVRGIEFTGDYQNGAFSGYANLALSHAMGEGVASGQFNFEQDELNYIATHYVHLDHDQAYTGSVGTAYVFQEIKYSADLIYGSGLRDGFANTGHLPFYTQANASMEHTFHSGSGGTLDGKFSIVNLFDHTYEIRDGSGIGVFAPQYGPRREFFVSLSKPF
jgi:outer membrane receptor protein involved in Fe transport